MGTARQALQLAGDWPARPQMRRLSIVTPQQGQGLMPSSEELNAWAHAVAVDGDRQAFAALFKHFAPRVKSYLLRSGGSAESAEELTQETMVLVWRKAEGYDPARAALSTWIFTIARNVRTDRFRQRGQLVLDNEETAHDGQALAEALPDLAETMDERLIAGQRERGVHDAMSRLSDEQSRILKLCYFEEQPHTQIARELDIPLGTVKSRIRLAVMHLRRLLEDFEA